MILSQIYKMFSHCITCTLGGDGIKLSLLLSIHFVVIQYDRDFNMRSSLVVPA